MDVGMGFTDLTKPWPAVGITRVWDVGAHWGAIHKGPGVYDWSVLDAFMHKAEGVGRVIYTVGGCPRWLSRNPDSTNAAAWMGPGSNAMPKDMNHYGEFLDALLSRYGKRIYAVEVWNEPQLAEFLYPYNAENLTVLAQMTQATKSIAARHGVLTVSAAVLPRSSSGGMTKASTYLKALGSVGWPVDYVTCHIYPLNGEDGTKWVSYLNDVRATLKSLGAPKANFPWVTETAFNLLGPDPGAAVAGWIKAAYEGAKADGVSVVCWYAWDRPDLKGPLMAEGTTAWSAIKQYAALVGGSESGEHCE